MIESLLEHSAEQPDEYHANRNRILQEIETKSLGQAFAYLHEKIEDSYAAISISILKIPNGENIATCLALAYKNINFIHENLGQYSDFINQFELDVERIKQGLKNPVLRQFASEMSAYALSKYYLNPTQEESFKKESEGLSKSERKKELTLKKNSDLEHVQLLYKHLSVFDGGRISWDYDFKDKNCHEKLTELKRSLDAFDELSFDREKFNQKNDKVLRQFNGFRYDLQQYVELFEYIFKLQEDYGTCNSFKDELPTGNEITLQHFKAHREAIKQHIADRFFMHDLTAKWSETVKASTIESAQKFFTPLLCRTSAGQTKLNQWIKEAANDLVFISPCSLRFMSPEAGNAVGYVSSRYPTVGVVCDRFSDKKTAHVSFHEFSHALSLGGFSFERFLLDIYCGGVSKLGMSFGEYIEDITNHCTLCFLTPEELSHERFKLSLSMERAWSHAPEKNAFVGFDFSYWRALEYLPEEPVNFLKQNFNSPDALIQRMSDEKEHFFSQLNEAPELVLSQLNSDYELITGFLTGDNSQFKEQLQLQGKTYSIYTSLEFESVNADSAEEFKENVVICTLNRIYQTLQMHSVDRKGQVLMDELKEYLRPYHFHWVDQGYRLLALNEALTVFMQLSQGKLAYEEKEFSALRWLQEEAQAIIEAVYRETEPLETDYKKQKTQTRSLFTLLNYDLQFYISDGYIGYFKKLKTALLAHPRETPSLPYLLAASIAPRVAVKLLTDDRERFFALLRLMEPEVETED